MTTTDLLKAGVQTETEKNSEKKYLVFATNPAIYFTAYLDTREGVVCAGFEVSDLNALIGVLNGGVDSRIRNRFPNTANIWFPITVIEIEPSKTSQESILRHFDHIYSPPGVMSIRYRGEYACLARAECNRLLNLNWREDPTIFTISSSEIVDHPLYEHLFDHSEINYYNENIIVKQIVDKECASFFENRNISANHYF